ncbi:hypothetical protein BGZ91_011464 [Linnemannia elongata]|nr:hypothetical protein BGZ91_011464 [Linnemannia elongata]KAG0077579.1 hypothetical protein BGZ90_006912 [Linnemannia elongata]
MDALELIFRHVVSAKVSSTQLFILSVLISQLTPESEAGIRTTSGVEIVKGTQTITMPWMPLPTCALNPNPLQNQMSQCPAPAPASQSSATPVYTLQFPVQSLAYHRSSSPSQQLDTSDICKVKPSFSPLDYPSPDQCLLSPLSLSSAVMHLRDQLRSIFSTRPSTSSSSSELLFCAMLSDPEDDVSNDSERGGSFVRQ